ncbi:hypothetical protein RB653_001456 [Dictyostelium firmibasis]|uniref:AB hydrolase-1 domain-containing protein n=1 Tax=Dictyostelium firmibasis TaxID=79012 RepID=A0AAN7TX01_9MYCE
MNRVKSLVNAVPLHFIKESLSINRSSIIDSSSVLKKKDFRYLRNNKRISTSIIFLHGLFGSSDNFKLTKKLLIKKFEFMSNEFDILLSLDNPNYYKLNDNIGIDLYNLDIRNHGSSPHSSEMSLNHIEDDLYLFLKDNKILEKKLEDPESHKIILVGHSMGGKSAMMFALNNPHLVDGLVPIDVSPSNYVGIHNHDTKFKAMLNASKLFTEPNTTKNLIEKEMINSGLEDKGERLYLLNNLKEMKIQKGVGSNHANNNHDHNNKDNLQYSWKLNVETLYKNQNKLLTFPNHDELIQSSLTMNKLPTFNKKTFFIGGADSHYLQLAHRENIHKLFPNHEIQLFQNSNHFVYAQRPKDFAELLYNYSKNVMKS